MTSQLTDIIEKEQDIIPFLKKLSNDDKRSLVPTIKKMHKKYNKGGFRNIERNTYGWVYDFGTDVQRSIIDKACFVCFNKTDIKKHISSINNLCIDKDYLDHIIPWYVPKWYNEVINEDIPWQLYYEQMMQLTRKGLIQLTPENIVSILVSRSSVSEMEKYHETLSEHFWYIFDIETEINWNREWKSRILSLSNNKKIDRFRLLSSSVSTATKGFDRPLSGWFFDLF